MSDEFGTSYSRESLFLVLLALLIFFLLLLRGPPSCTDPMPRLAPRPSPGNQLMIVITSLKIERGLALQDMIAGAYDFLQTVELPNQSRIYLLDHLGQCE
jgi:hypothetical protein